MSLADYGREAAWAERPGQWERPGQSERSGRAEPLGQSESQPDGASWFALCVKPRHEKSAAAALRFKGYDEFLPLYRARARWSDRVKVTQRPLFPGYVFCRLDIRHRVPVLNTPGVLRVIGHGREPVALEDREIDALKVVVRSGLPAEPWPFLNVGCRIGIEEGPLRGIEGTLLEIKGRDRLVLSVGLLQRSIAVEVDRRWVLPLRTDRPRTFAAAS